MTGIPEREKILNDYYVENGSKHEWLGGCRRFDWVHEWLGGCRRFDNVPLKVIKELVDKGYLELSEAQNCSPTTMEFMEFVQDYQDEFVFHGYAISADRDDCRVTVEGIKLKEGVSLDDIEVDTMLDFIEWFRTADEFEIRTTLYCWWD